MCGLNGIISNKAIDYLNNLNLMDIAINHTNYFFSKVDVIN